MEGHLRAKKMKIQKVHRTEAKKITELTMRSKNHWNYGAAQIAEWRDELTLTPEYIDKEQVYKLEVSGRLVGFYAFHPENSEVIALNFLFVEPEYIGKGYGKILITDFLKRIEKLDYRKVTLDADPNTENFYKAIGFNVVGRRKSAIKDRFLPIMEMDLSKLASNKE